MAKHKESRIKCPYCKEQIKVMLFPNKGNKKGQCPLCGKVFSITHI